VPREWTGKEWVEVRKVGGDKPPNPKLYIKTSWAELTDLMVKAGTDRATRLLMVLRLQSELEGWGWITPRACLLADVELVDRHYYEAVSRLERAGLIEVARSPGKRAKVRLSRRQTKR
jgi:hypothetical protein